MSIRSRWVPVARPLPTRARILALIALVLAVNFAGCVAPAPDLPLTTLGTADPDAPITFTWPAPVAFDGGGAPVPFPDVARGTGDARRFGDALVPGAGAEPNIGITSSGAVFVTTNDQVRRSTDKGQTWEVVHDFVTPGHPIVEDRFGTADPMLWVDKVTDRVYANHMHPALQCTYLAWSDDEGASWTERPLACGSPYIDHQKLMTAPPGPATPPGIAALMPYPSVVYLCVNKIELGMWCATSFDGGITWPYDTAANPGDEACGNLNGHPAAFPDGTIAVALSNGHSGCKRGLTVVVSEDSGFTWTKRTCAPDATQYEVDADITVTPDGTAYMLFRNGDERAWLARSTDKFVTCELFPIAPPDHTLNVFAGIASGDDGRIAMAYLGTRDPQSLRARPSDATPGSQWHLFVTTSYDADAANPTFVTEQVTPDEDPVQVGCVWLGGGEGGPFKCRNLLDFIDAVSDDDGRFWIVITDGCTPRNGCTGMPVQSDYQSRDSQIAVAAQLSGESLFADVGMLPEINLDRPRPTLRPVAEPGGGAR